MNKKLLVLPVLALAVGMMTGCTKDDLKALQDHDAEQDSRLDALENDVNGIKNQISGLQTEMNTKIQEAKDDYGAKVNAINAQIAADEAALTTLTNNFTSDKAALQADYEAKIKAVDDKYAPLMETTNGKIAALETNLAAAQEAFTTQIANLVQADTGLRNDLTALQNTFQSKLQEINAAIQANADDILDLQDRLDLDEADLDEVYAAVQALYEDIADFGTYLVDQEFDSLYMALYYCIAYAEFYTDYVADPIAEDLATLAENVESLADSASEAINSLATNLNSVVQYINSFVESYQEDMEALAEMLGDMDESIAGLIEEVGNLGEELEDANERLDALEALEAADKAELQQDLTDAVDALEEALAAQAQDLQDEIDDLNSDLSDLADDLDAQIADIYAHYNPLINNLTSRVGALEDVPVYQVTFQPCYENIDGSTPDPIVVNVLKGDKVDAPDIEREGFILNRWLLNGEASQPWVFYGYSVTEDMELHAEWVEDGVHPYDYANPIVIREGTLEEEGIKRYAKIGANDFVEMNVKAAYFFLDSTSQPSSDKFTISGTVEGGVFYEGMEVCIKGSNYSEREPLFFREPLSVVNEHGDNFALPGDYVTLTFELNPRSDGLWNVNRGNLICEKGKQIISQNFVGALHMYSSEEVSAINAAGGYARYYSSTNLSTQKFYLRNVSHDSKDDVTFSLDSGASIGAGETKNAVLSLTYSYDDTFIPRGTRIPVERESDGAPCGYFDVEDYDVVSYFQHSYYDEISDYYVYRCAKIYGTSLGNGVYSFDLSGLQTFVGGISSSYKPDPKFYDLDKPRARDFEDWDAVYEETDEASSDHSKVYTVFYDYYDNLLCYNMSGNGVQYAGSGTVSYFIFQPTQLLDIEFEEAAIIRFLRNDNEINECKYKGVWLFSWVNGQFVQGERIYSFDNLPNGAFIGLGNAGGEFPTDCNTVRAIFYIGNN